MTRRQMIIGALATLLLLLLAGALTLDTLARSALESSLGRTFGTEASVESLDLGVVSGQVALEGLSVANPEGFGDAPSSPCGAGGGRRAWPTSSATPWRSTS